MAVGMTAFVAVGVESSGGTASYSVSPVAFLPFVSETLTQGKSTLDSQAITGLFDVLQRCDGPDNIGGSITVEVQPSTIGYLLRSVFDTCTAAAADDAANDWRSIQSSFANVYVHQFIAKQAIFQSGSGSDLPTLTLHKYLGPSASSDSSFAFYQMAGSQMELTCDVGNYARATFDFVGKNAGKTARVTPSTPEQVCMTGVQCSVSIDGAGNASFETVTVRLNNNLEQKFLLNGSAQAELLRRTNFRTVEVNGTMSFQDHTQSARFLASSLGQLKVILTSDTNMATGHPHQLQITVPQFRYTALNPQVGGPGYISVPFQGVGEYHTGSGTALEILVVTSRSADWTTNS